PCYFRSFLFFLPPAPPLLSPLPLHDALPILPARPRAHRAGGGGALSRRSTGHREDEHELLRRRRLHGAARGERPAAGADCRHREDRKSTRLNSSHVSISYAVFCLKKKKKNKR